MGNQIWTLFVASIGVYSTYVFFFNFVLPEDTVMRDTDTQQYIDPKVTDLIILKIQLLSVVCNFFYSKHISSEGI